MDNKTYEKMQMAKKYKDVVAMGKLYKEYPYENVIKFEYARLLKLKGNKNKSKELLLEIVSKNKNDFYSILELGKIEKELGNIEKAREYFKALLGTKSERYAILELGKLEKAQGNLDKARKYFEKLVEKYKDPFGILELGILEKGQENIDKARKCFEKLVKKYKDPFGILELGKLEKEEGNIELARKYFISLLNTKNEIYAKLELGKLEKEEGNIELARKYFISLLDTKSEIYAKLELGKLEKEEGNIELARKYFISLLDTKSEIYAKLELGILEKEEGNIKLARKYFTSLLSTKNKIYAMRTLVLLELLEKNYNLSFKYINEALGQKIEILPDIIIFISKELNIFFDLEYENMKYNYSMNQLLDYDEYCAIEHIVDRHIQEDDSATSFNKKVDVYKLFNVVKDYLSEENKINKLSFNDLYLLRMDNIGADGENYLLVVTLPHSKDILTMYPVKDKISTNKYIEEYENNGEKTLIKK